MSSAELHDPQAKPALEVRDVVVSYGGVIAVDEVSFDIPTGSIVGLIGPNGAGKTTVFDAITGLVSVDRGRVFLRGRDVTGLSTAARARAGLGRSFQDGRLFPSLSVAETLAAAFERHQTRQGPVSTALSLPWVRKAERKIRERADELIELMGLEAFRDKFVSELSTGSRRIVDLACMLAHEPDVLLLDEPSSGIAQKETEALGPLLGRVKETLGCTMLLIEHDMPLITSVSDELIALETGRVIARGKPREVTNDPQVIEAYLGTDERIIARSGTRGAEVEDADTPPKKRKRPARRRRTTTTKTTKGKSVSKRTTSAKISKGKASKKKASKKKASKKAAAGTSSSKTTKKAAKRSARRATKKDSKSASSSKTTSKKTGKKTTSRKRTKGSSS